MPKDQPQARKHYPPPHTRIPNLTSPLTPTERELYNHIDRWGLKGCWKSNNTLAHDLALCKRSIQRARKSLVAREIIISVRTGRRTWRMWARYHPAVKACAILFCKGLHFDNRFYEPKQTPAQRVTNCHPLGDKLSPNVYRLPEPIGSSGSKQCSKEPPTATEFSSTTQGDSVPLKPLGRKLHGSGIGSGRKRQKLSLVEALKKYHTQFCILKQRIGNHKDAFRIFRAAYEMEVLDQDYVWTINLETNAKEIRTLICVT